MSDNGYKVYASEQFVEDKLNGLNTGGVQPDWNQYDESAPDYIKNRPFYEDPGLLLKESIITVDAEGYAQLPENKMTQNTYSIKVVLNGVEYFCNRTSYDDEMVYSNDDMSGEIIAKYDDASVRFKTTEPEGTVFTITIFNGYSSTILINEKFIPYSIARTSEIVQSDWNQNDEYLNDYIKNRPFYDLGYVLEETTYPAGREYVSFSGNSLKLKADTTYTVNWNGTEYTCPAIVNNWGTVYIGNVSLYESSFSDTGEPFAAYYDGWYSELKINDSSEVTVSIKQEDSIKQIDNKYLEPFEYTASTDSIDVLTWDGDLTGREVVNKTMMTSADMYVHISEITPQLQEVQNGGVFTAIIQGEQRTSTFTSDNINANSDSIVITNSNFPFISIILNDNVTVLGVVFPKKGVYFFNGPVEPSIMVTSLQINGYSFSNYSWKLKEEYLPNTVPTSSTSECKEIILHSSTEGSNKKFKITIDDEGTLKVEQIISMEDKLIDFEYTKNANGTYTITDWKGTLNGENSVDLVVPDDSSIIF